MNMVNRAGSLRGLPALRLSGICQVGRGKGSSEVFWQVEGCSGGVS